MPGFEKGKIKVVWIESDPGKIYSKMFDVKKEAQEFAKAKGENYLIFALIKQSRMEEFSWRLLPYGRYKFYLRLTQSINTVRGVF